MTLPASEAAPAPAVRARYLKTMLVTLGRFGGAAEAVRARVGAPLFEQIDGETPTAWLPIECNVVLVEAIALELGPERAHAYFREAANQVYETSLFKGFVHMASNLFGLTPATYVKLAPKGWSLAYRDGGEFTAFSRGENEASLEFRQVPRPCATAVWLEAARSSFYSCFDLCGAVDGRIEWGELDLRARRAVFLFRWGPASRQR
jgi:hypothetical protein